MKSIATDWDLGDIYVVVLDNASYMLKATDETLNYNIPTVMKNQLRMVTTATRTILSRTRSGLMPPSSSQAFYNKTGEFQLRTFESAEVQRLIFT